MQQQYGQVDHVFQSNRLYVCAYECKMQQRLSVLVDQEEKYRLIEEAREGEEGLNFLLICVKTFARENETTKAG